MTAGRLLKHATSMSVPDSVSMSVSCQFHCPRQVNFSVRVPLSKYTSMSMAVQHTGTRTCIVIAQYIPVHKHIEAHTWTRTRTRAWVGTQSTQSAGPVRFLIFSSISISLLASPVAGRKPQCSAGAD
jgi:hypothetical protein